VKTKESQVFPKPPSNRKVIRVDIRNSQKDLLISKRSISLFVLDVLKELDVSCDEIAIHFVTARAIAKLHESYFDDPTPTDTISFPLDAPGSTPNCYLGEVFVCPKVAVEYAKRHQLDPERETMLYVVHGILHLLGYDDLDAESRKVMRRMERKCMQLLRGSNGRKRTQKDRKGRMDGAKDKEGKFVF